MIIRFTFILLTAFIVSCTNSNTNKEPGKKDEVVNPPPQPTPLPQPQPQPRPQPTPLPPPPEPKPKISIYGSGALTGQTAIFEASQSLGGKGGALGEILPLASNTLPSKVKQITKKKIDRVRESIKSEKCQIDVERPTDTIDPSNGAAALFPRMKVKIGGQDCPLETTLDMRVVVESRDSRDFCKDSSSVKVCKFTGKAEINYRVLDDKLIEELQVKKGEMTMLFTVEQTFPGSSISSSREATNMIMTGRTEFKFKTIDVKDESHLVTGTQDFDVNMSLPTTGDPKIPQQMNATVKEDVKYLDETAKTSSAFSANLDINGSKTEDSYVLDGMNVTADGYSCEREKFANSMVAFGKKENNQLPSPIPNPMPNPGRRPGEIPPPPIGLQPEIFHQTPRRSGSI